MPRALSHLVCGWVSIPEYVFSAGRQSPRERTWRELSLLANSPLRGQRGDRTVTPVEVPNTDTQEEKGSIL